MGITLENIKKIWLSGNAIHLQLKDGRSAKELFTDYPRLKNATGKQRQHYITSEFGMHWPDIDEDLSFEGFFADKEVSEIGKIFSNFSEINVSAFARKSGIAQPLMADYISGKKKPGKQRKKEIEKSLHELGKALLELNL